MVHLYKARSIMLSSTGFLQRQLTKWIQTKPNIFSGFWNYCLLFLSRIRLFINFNGAEAELSCQRT
jgi:hypothetical protein